MTTISARGARRVAALLFAASLALGTAAMLPAPAEAAGPTNDDFVNAQVLTGLPAAASGSLVGATAQPGETMARGYALSATVWFSWTAPSSGPVFMDLFDGPDVDTVMAVYTLAGKTLTAVAQNDDYDSAAHHERSAVSLVAAAGTTYYIQIGGYNDTKRGGVSLKITPITTGLTGTVTRPDGTPVAGACVSVTTSSPSQTTITNAEGRYAAPTAVGAATVNVSNCLGTADVTTSTPVSGIGVTSGAVTTVAPIVEAASGRSISGRVVDQNGAPVSHTCVAATSTSPAVGVTGYTDATGHYVIRGLPAASYTVAASGCGNVYVAGSATAPSPVDLSSATSATVPDLQLTLRVAISGTVLNSSGAPFTTACVGAYVGTTLISSSPTSTSTDAPGSYILVLPIGTYQLKATDSAGCSGAVTQTLWFNQTGTQTAASALTLGAGQALTGGSFDFRTGAGPLAAPALGLNGSPFVSPVCVSARSAAGGSASALAATQGTNAAAQAKLARDNASLKKLNKQLKTAKKKAKRTHSRKAKKSVKKLSTKVRAVKRTIAADTAAAKAAAGTVGSSTAAVAAANASVAAAC